MVIVNFFIFLVKKGTADDDAMFGIGQAYKPYPTNMRQRVVATHI